MKIFKVLLTTLFTFMLSPFGNASSLSQDNHTEFETLATSCTTKINKYNGNCISPSSCNGGVYNNLCPGSSKCCVQDVNSKWIYWPYVDQDEFKGLFPLLSDTRKDTLYPWFNDALSDVLHDKKGNQKCDIIACFSAQVGHESVDLSTFEEFASGEAYEGRCKGLGNCQVGDGVKYKGRGAIQITGRSNYQKASDFIGTNFIDSPDLLVLPSYGFKASVWFWVSNELNQYCTGNQNDFFILTRKINGGLNGIEDRLNKWTRAKNVLKC